MSSSVPLVSMLLTTAMLVLVLKVSGVHGVATKVCTSTDRSNSRGLCTGHLYSTIMLACDIFRPVNKRDVMTDPVNTMDDIVLAKPNALSFLTKKQSSFTVICECCFNQCTVSEMLDYCSLFGRGKKI